MAERKASAKRRPADEAPFTRDELQRRHAYLLRYRRRRLRQLIELAEERLAKLKVPPTSWQVLRLTRSGQFTFDVTAALVLGPELVPNTTAPDDPVQPPPAAVLEDWHRLRGQVAAEGKYKRSDPRVDLHARQADPALYRTLFPPPPSGGGRYSEAWLAAEAACLANAALDARTLDARMEERERQAEQYERALSGDERARRQIEAERARRRPAQVESGEVSAQKNKQRTAAKYAEDRTEILRMCLHDGYSPDEAVRAQMQRRDLTSEESYKKAIGWRRLKKQLTPPNRRRRSAVRADSLRQLPART